MESENNTEFSYDDGELKNKRKSPFKKFYQTNSDKAVSMVEDWIIKTNPTAYRILKFLIQNMDHYNAVVCSYKVFQEYFQLSQPSVSRAIKFLKDNKFIYVVKSGTSNIYLVNKTLYWNSWGTNYASAKFGVNIIINLSEQEKETQKKIQKQLQSQRECHLKDVKRLPPLSDSLLEKMSYKSDNSYKIPSSEEKIKRIPIILSEKEKEFIREVKENKKLLELVL